VSGPFGRSEELTAKPDIPEDARALITARLSSIAAEEDIRVPFAIESGSRAWGFASTDSDYDVRFICAHHRDWYVSLKERRDVIERPIGADLIDIGGWDVRKALRLMLRSNPAFYEWLVSPITYYVAGSFRAQSRALFEAHASPRALAHHYQNIAQGHWRREIADNDAPRLKKYFYVIRPLLSLMHVSRTLSPPPMQLDALLVGSGIPDDVAAMVLNLRERKRSATELGKSARIALLDDWITQSLADLEPVGRSLPDREYDEAALRLADDLYRRTIGAV